MPANPNSSAPANVPVLILMPGKKGRWHKAILCETKGRVGLRWKILFSGKQLVAGREFQPKEWMPLLPENGGVQ
jgi:hypothetical protein